MSSKRPEKIYADLSIEVQGEFFSSPTPQTYDVTAQRAAVTYSYTPPANGNNNYQIHNRRYIGNKHKLIDWIFSILLKRCEGDSFADIFAGTGSVAAVASQHFSKITVNDFLYSNNVIYKAFFGKGECSESKVAEFIDKYNNLSPASLASNYFSDNFGGKYFSVGSAKMIGFIREDIEQNKSNLSDKEYSTLITSLLYSMDKIANTVGHYDAYFKKESIQDKFFMKSINPVEMESVAIHREDTTELVKNIQADIMYIDPPYNSRQYSRFYHILENVTKWDKPNLYGIALKPPSENMSDYCRVNAYNKFNELIGDINAKYIVVSYNNTYESKSNSSRNKITLSQMNETLVSKGSTEIFEKDYRHFNAGNTNFNNHKEYLFVTKVPLTH